MSVIQLRGPRLQRASVVGLPHSDRSSLDRPQYQFGPVGRCPGRGTLLVSLSDDSVSVTGPVGTDPASNRYAEARAAFRHIWAHCRCGLELGAVLHFDTPTSADVPPTPISEGIDELEAGLVVPPRAAGQSLLGPGVERAIAFTNQYPDYEATLVVFSDFELFDPEPSEALSRLDEFPGAVHAIVLEGKLPDGLLADRIQVTRIGRNDQPGAVARALFGSLVQHRRP